jgi:hypothetical protein
MTPHHSLALALDPSLILHAGGLTPDLWQHQFLASIERQVLRNCCRQAGKSAVVSALALHTILFSPGSLVLILSPSQRPSGEMFRKVLDHYNHIDRPVKATYETQLKLGLATNNP